MNPIKVIGRMIDGSEDQLWFVVGRVMRVPGAAEAADAAMREFEQFQDGHSASQLHHNRHYGVPETDGDVMSRARLARGGRGETNAPLGKFARSVSEGGQPPACPDCIRVGRVNSLGCQGCYQERKAYYQRVADNPCADHCSDPAAHAEGGHDV